MSLQLFSNKPTVTNHHNIVISVSCIVNYNIIIINYFYLLVEILVQIIRQQKQKQKINSVLNLNNRAIIESHESAKQTRPGDLIPLHIKVKTDVTFGCGPASREQVIHKTSIDISRNNSMALRSLRDLIPQGICQRDSALVLAVWTLLVPLKSCSEIIKALRILTLSRCPVGNERKNTK